MGVSCSTSLIVGIYIDEHLDVQTKKEGYFMFDPKTGKPTDKWVEDLTVHELTFGNKTYREEHQGDHEFEFYYELGCDEFLNLEFNRDTKLKWFYDDNNPYKSVIGLDIFSSGDLMYGADKEFSIDVETLQEKINEAKELIKDFFDLDVEPKLIVKSYVG